MAQRKARGVVTVADVAEHAGVSSGTVSKALNGRGQLKSETRQRVLASAEKLGFAPNLLARSLLSGRTYTVGVLTTDSVGRFTIPLLTGAEDALGAGQMSMLLCESRGDAIREQHYLRVLMARRVDGIIITGRSSNVRPSLGQDFPIPVVYALCQSDSMEDLSVLHDDEKGAEMAVNHLVETGRSRIAHVSGPPRHAATQNRSRGAATALAAAGLSLVLGEPLHGEWSEAWGREAAQRLMRSGERFNGVFCASDQIARGVADGLREGGVAVPEDVGIVGVDNWLPMAEASRPPLTTIDLNLAELGHIAATRLLSAIEGKDAASGIERVPAFLVKRRSTEIG
ncbi:LacI family DNA-binding transcriptional regulator [Glaciibacter flavus]|uniref:LacI family DNA-binding transcriptional regulator n=1 Tax=Orlajensenia flava TaxID=2565934 RepID=UPI003AFF8E90